MAIMFYCAHKERRMNSGIQRTRNEQNKTEICKHVAGGRTRLHNTQSAAISCGEGLWNGSALAYYGHQAAGKTFPIYLVPNE